MIRIDRKTLVLVCLIFTFLMALTVYCQNTNPESNLKIVKHFFLDGYAARNNKVIYETISKDYVGYSNGIKNKQKGPEYQIKGIENELKVHPDFRIKIDDIFPSIDDKVTVRWTANWTDQQTSKEATLYGIWIAEVKDNKIVKGWNIFDLLGTSRRLKN